MSFFRFTAVAGGWLEKAGFVKLEHPSVANRHFIVVGTFLVGFGVSGAVLWILSPRTELWVALLSAATWSAVNYAIGRLSPTWATIAWSVVVPTILVLST